MQDRRPSRLRWYVLGLLALIYVCNVADRLILSILAQDIKEELVLSDWELGLLIGPAIAFFYAILGIPMAYIADRTHRVRFLASCLALWSLLTALGGAAANALQLGLARIGVSAVEAGGSPTSSSLVADYFPPRERPTAMGIYAAASTVGVMVSFALGGLVNAQIGWRWTLVAAGAPGLLLAIVLVVTVAEPRRGAEDGHGSDGTKRLAPPKSLITSIRTLWSLPFFMQVVVAAGLSNFCFHAVLNWGPSLIIRKFYAGTDQAGMILGLGIALCGGVAAVIGGRVTSRLMGRGIAGPLKIAAALQFLSAPLMLASLFATRLDVTVILMCCAFGFQSFFVPIYWSVSQSYVPAEMRAMASAFMLLAIAFVGTGISAPVIGALSDALQPRWGDASLQWALAFGTIMNLVVAWLFFRAGRTASRLPVPSHEPALA